MNRRAIREHTFKLVFRAEFYPPQELDGQFAQYFQEEECQDISEAERMLLTGKAKEIVGHIPELDASLSQAMEGWRIGRIGKVELGILRLAIYELKYDEQVPWKVAVNEAVELAKKYSGEDAPGFVNGVLARVIRAEHLDQREEASVKAPAGE